MRGISGSLGLCIVCFVSGYIGCSAAGCASVDWLKRYQSAEQRTEMSEDSTHYRRIIDATILALKEREIDTLSIVSTANWKVSNDSSYYYVRVQRRKDTLNELLFLERIVGIVVLKREDLECIVTVWL